MKYSSYVNSYYTGVSYYCQYADSFVDCGDKKCSECSLPKKSKAGESKKIKAQTTL